MAYLFICFVVNLLCNKYIKCGGACQTGKLWITFYIKCGAWYKSTKVQSGRWHLLRRCAGVVSPCFWSLLIDVYIIGVVGGGCGRGDIGEKFRCYWEIF